jgi:hypothetical protein
VETAGRVLLCAALILAILGVSALALSKLGVDRLPATFTWRSDNVTVFVPIGLMVVASIVATRPRGPGSRTRSSQSDLDPGRVAHSRPGLAHSRSWAARPPNGTIPISAAVPEARGPEQLRTSGLLRDGR